MGPTSRDAFKSNKASLFGIIQGGVFEELREKSLEELLKIEFEGYALGDCLLESPKTSIELLNK